MKSETDLERKRPAAGDDGGRRSYPAILSEKPAERFPLPAFRFTRRWRGGQAPVEYLLVTVSLLFVFVFMYRFLQGFLAKEFKAGGTIVLRMYKEDPW